MEAIQKIVDHLKADNVFEAMDLIKLTLSERAHKVVQETRVAAAETFGLTRVEEVQSKKDEDKSKDDDKEKEEGEKENKDE